MSAPPHPRGSPCTGCGHSPPPLKEELSSGERLLSDQKVSTLTTAFALPGSPHGHLRLSMSQANSSAASRSASGALCLCEQYTRSLDPSLSFLPLARSGPPPASPGDPPPRQLSDRSPLYALCCLQRPDSLLTSSLWWGGHCPSRLPLPHACTWGPQ